jgi:hypothetical protein
VGDEELTERVICSEKFMRPDNMKLPKEFNPYLNGCPDCRGCEDYNTKCKYYSPVTFHKRRK